jgi:MFS family permease
MFNRFRKTYNMFSKDFWLLMTASFIDMLGRSLVFPFFSLFLTRKFDVGMTEVGAMFLVWALTSGLIGNIVGGALADKFGRKTNIIFGLVASALSALMMIVIDDLKLFYIVIGVIGIFEDIAGPARQAMVADLVPEDLRTDAYGMLRIVFNLAAAIGPAIGGFMATRSFAILFIADVIISVGVALFVFFLLPETKPELAVDEQDTQTVLRTFKGYGVVLKDKVYMTFILFSALSTLMYFNMNSSMSVYLVNHRGISPAQFGYILTLNAGMVVVLQLLFTRMTAKLRPMVAIMIGNILYVVGFTMYGIFNTYLMFVVAMIIITIGEMIYAPKEQMVFANIAPDHMRGRYMAIGNFSWILPISIGPLGAGLIMDHLDPRFVWFAAGISGLLSVIGFLFLHLRSSERFEPNPAMPKQEKTAPMPEFVHPEAVVSYE